MKAGTLELDLIANVARLQSDMAAIKKAVGASMASVTTDATAAAASLDRVGRESGARAAAGIGQVGASSKLASHHVTNLAFQAQDLSLQLVAAAGSSAPLRMAFMALFQQGSQVQGIMMQAGMGVGAFAKEVAVMARLIKVSGDAGLAATAASTATTARAIASELARAEAAGVAAAAEVALASASYSVLAGTDAEAAALARLAAARQAQAVANGEAAVAAAALTTANEAASASAAAAAAAESVALAPLAIVLGVVAIAAGGAALAIGGIEKQANEGANMKAYAQSLGLTAKEIRNLKDVTVTWGDTAKAVFQVAGRAIWGAIGPAVTSVWGTMKEWLGWIGEGVKSAVNFLIGGFVGAFNGIKATWRLFPAMLGDLVVQGANFAIGAIESLVNAAIDRINNFARGANGLLHSVGLDRIFGQFGMIDHVQLGRVENQWKGAADKVAGAFKSEMAKAMGTDYVGKIGGAVVGAITSQARQNARDRIRAEAEKKGYLDPDKAKKPKVDHHAEALARDAEATEAAIKGLYALADAYGVSDAAALKAAATAKATEQAIRKQGDVDAFVARELRKQVAARVADSAKVIADLRAQTSAQDTVNKAVADGIIPASAAADELAKATQLRTLQTTLALAIMNKDTEGARRATDQIQAMTGAIDENTRAKANAKALADIGQVGDNIEMMRLELTLLGATNRERAVAIAGLKAEQEARNTMRGADTATVGTFIAKRKEEAAATAELASAQAQFNGELQVSIDLAAAAGDQIARAFGKAGSAISDVIQILGTYAKRQKDIDDQVSAGTLSKANAQRRSTSLQIESYGALAGAAKGLFKEHSAGYEAMAAAEKAFAVVQLANTAVNLAAGAAKMFATLGPWAFPAVAAMVAVMAGFGISAAGGHGNGHGMSAEDAQKAQGAGSVLGDATAKSSSIGHALDIMAKNSSAELEYSNAMARSLRSIESGIDALTSTIARQLGVSGGAFDTSGLGLGTNTSVSGLAKFAVGGLWSLVPGIGDVLNGIAKALFGTTTTKSLIDQGIQFYSATLGSIMAGGIQGASYSLIEIVKKRKFLGISTGTSTSNQTLLGTLDNAVQDQASLILTSIYGSIVTAAETIGVSGIEQMLQGFTVNLGKISLDGLKGDEIKDAISAVFSKAADDMAAYALPGLAVFQKVGEGLFETLTRLAKDYTTVDVQLESIGRTFGAVGVSSLEARESLIDLFGSLDDFVEQTSFYREHFLTEAQQIVPVMTAVAAEMARLGLSGVTTIAQFKAVVDGLDLTTASGQATYAALMAVAQGFYAVDQYQAATASKRADLEIQLMQAQGNAAGALAAQRAAELAAMDESLRGLQQQIYLYQDIATAKDVLTEAYKREHDALQATIDKFGAFSTSLRDFRDSLAGGPSGGLSYTQALAKLMSTGGLAAAGDETALGNLQGVSNDFLGVAKDRASSLEQYRRDVALVTGYVSNAIGAADSAVDYARAQLAALDQSVTGLIDINESVISVHDAIVALERLLVQANPGYQIVDGAGLQPVVPVPLGAAMMPASSVDTEAAIADLTEEVQNNRTALEAIKVDTGKMARTFDRWNDDGIPVRNTPDGEPLTVVAP